MKQQFTVICDRCKESVSMIFISGEGAKEIQLLAGGTEGHECYVNAYSIIPSSAKVQIIPVKNFKHSYITKGVVNTYGNGCGWAAKDGKMMRSPLTSLSQVPDDATHIVWVND